MTRDKWEELFQSVIEHIRENHEQEINDAYDYFWEEDDPEEFLGGTTLAMGFHNFEDWMVCDYVDKPTGKTFIESYINAKSPSAEDKSALGAMQDSHISLFEIKSVGDTVTLTDICSESEITLADDRLKCLSPGDMFGARILELGDDRIMTNAIYPFGSKYKDAVMKHLEGMYKRYEKHYDDPTMQKFLRQETYTINTVWVTCLFRAK